MQSGPKLEEIFFLKKGTLGLETKEWVSVCTYSMHVRSDNSHIMQNGGSRERSF